MLNCRETSRLVSETLDHDLPLRDRISMRLHLMMCKFCRRYFSQIRFMRDAIKLAGDDLNDCDGTTGVKMPDSAKERVKRNMRGR